MDTATQQLGFLLELEARHDDLLRRLDELDQRVEKALASCLIERDHLLGKTQDVSAIAMPNAREMLKAA